MRRVIFLFALFLAGVGLAGQASGQTVVTSGSFCSPAGATGVTSTGIPMTCAITATDSQLRWRATSEVTTTTTVAAVTTTTVAGTSTTTTVPAATTTTTVPTAAPAAPTPAQLALTG